MDGAENQRKGNQDALERKNYRPVPLKLGDVHSGVSITTSWERGRPARTSLAQLHLPPPRRSTRNGAVPGPLCKGCSRFVPHYHSPLEGESHEMKTTWERGRPARTRPAQLHLPPPRRSTGTAPFPDHCVKDVPGLYLITPPLRGSRRSRAARRRLMRWGVEASPPAPRGHAGSLQHRPDRLKTLVPRSPLSVRVEQDSTYTGFNHSQ